MAISALTHWLKLRLLTGQNVELMVHPPYSPDLALLFIAACQEKIAWSTIFVKILLECSKTNVLEVSQSEWKTNINDGRTSKHFEYCYAKKCQTFLWKCQISAGIHQTYARTEIYVVHNEYSQLIR